MEGLDKIAKLVDRAEVILVTSTLTRAEMLHSKTSKEAMKKFDGLLRRSNVVAQNVDLPIAKLTSEVMDFYINSDFEMLTPDAIHLATAIYYSAEEFHTFDGVDVAKKPRKPTRYKRCGLLLLDGNVAGHNLKVRRPSADQYELSLPPLPDESAEPQFQLQPNESPAEQATLKLLPTAKSNPSNN